MSAICVVGSLNMDVVICGERFPAEGESLMVGEVAFHPGGKGGNAAVCARRSGAELFFVGRVGDDAFGGELVRGLGEEGIDTSLVEVDREVATGTAVILVNPGTGDNAIMVAPGANFAISAAQVAGVRDRIASADAMLLSLETPMEVILAAARIGRETGTLTVLDAGPVCRLTPETMRELVAAVDVVSPNETEARALTGKRISDLQSASEVGYNLVERGAKHVVLKLGAAGSLYTDGSETRHVPAFSVDPVDTTGAGDAFTGALAVAWARGMVMDDILRYANAAGALACLIDGAQPSMPTRDAIEELLKENAR